MAITYTILHEFPGRELENAWRGFLTRVELPSHYCAPAFFKEPFWAGKQPFAVLALDGGKVLGVATGLREDHHVQCGLPFRPQICIEATGNQREVESTLRHGLMEEAGSAQLLSVYSWSPIDSFHGDGFRFLRTTGVVMLDLTKGADTLFKEFTADKRRNIRFSIKHGVEARPATTPHDIEEFYEVYQAWRATSRKEIEGTEIPFETFQQAFALTENRLLLVARYEGKAIAANAFRFHRGGLFESAANQSIPEFVHLKPNELMQWRGIEWACQNGMKRHSLGGTHFFLRGFGSTIMPVYRYRMDRTWLRQHDLRESVSSLGLEWRKRIPRPVKQKVRQILGKF